MGLDAIGCHTGDAHAGAFDMFAPDDEWAEEETVEPVPPAPAAVPHEGAAGTALLGAVFADSHAGTTEAVQSRLAVLSPDDRTELLTSPALPMD